jgi:hypothetical protein
MEENGRVILKYALSVRLILILGVLMWTAMMIALLGSGTDTGSAWMLILIFLSLTLGPAINVNMTWFAYSEQGVEWHNPLRRPVYIRWEEIIAIRRISSGWSIEAPVQRIQIPYHLRDLKELSKVIEKRVPNEKWVRS